MIAVVTRVQSASVTVDGEVVGQIQQGLLALVGVTRDDAEAQIDWMARKLLGLRIFRNGLKHFDLDVSQAGGQVLLVSNFTVSGRTCKGRRPSLDLASPPELAEPVFNRLVERVRASGIVTQTGRFRADMLVQSVNDGPVTFILDSSCPDPQTPETTDPGRPVCP
jgi:D-aminoacyl-tRNA deacylase